MGGMQPMGQPMGGMPGDYMVEVSAFPCSSGTFSHASLCHPEQSPVLQSTAQATSEPDHSSLVKRDPFSGGVLRAEIHGDRRLSVLPLRSSRTVPVVLSVRQARHNIQKWRAH